MVNSVDYRPGRVIVVGAGIAGLAAANALANAGVDVVVLEARDRIGGRTHTAELAGRPIDLGATFIHDPKGNPLTQLARQAGVRTRRLSVQGPIQRVDHLFDDTAGWLDRRTHRRLLRLLADFEAAAPGIMRRLGDQASVAAVVDTFLSGAASPDEALARMVLQTIMESYTSGDLTDISALGFADLAEDGGEHDDVPLGGYRRLIDALAGPVAIQCSTIVTSIAVEPDGVRIQDSDGGVHQASHAIVTVPLGVLKAGAIDFSPGLPEPTVAAVRRLGFGQLEKVVLTFDRRFWSAVKPAFYLPGLVPTWFDLTSAAGGPTLVGVCAAGAARQFADLGPEVAITSAVDQLRRAFGPSVPPPTAATTTCWARDPYTRGAYSYLSVGSTKADIEALATPAHDRLLFAGEATSVDRQAGADGAYLSGIREANRLLQSDGFHLDRVQTEPMPR